jgi:hypothetical protein
MRPDKLEGSPEGPARFRSRVVLMAEEIGHAKHLGLAQP